MRLPSMKYEDRITKQIQVRFGGLNHTVGAGDGEIFDMKNLTGDHYPVLATRRKRWNYRKLETPGGIFGWNGLCWVDGTGFYYHGEKKGNVEQGQKTFCSIGATIIIMPDKCCYNTQTDQFQRMESEWKGEVLAFGNGTLYGEKAEANTVFCPGVTWDSFFKIGDAVTISGCTKHPENNKTAIIRQINGDKLCFYEHIFKMDEAKDTYEETGQMVVARTVPDLKFICENENRLWGCDDTTIYASKLGDPFNWNVFDGLESDSYAITPGSTGRFTGCISYRGFAIFFKENRIYKIYGSVPSSFKAVESASIGLAEENDRSLAVAGEVLFYMSRNGIMAYTGGIPQSVSEPFGLERFSNAAAGSDGMKYYVSMKGENGSWWLYVYDTQKGMWHKEDETNVTHFALDGGNLYAMTKEGDILIIGNDRNPKEGAVEETTVPWMVEFADFTEESPNKKSIGKLQIRLELEEGAAMDMFIQYDSDGIWNRVRTLLSDGVRRSYYLPVIPRRCDHYRLKFEGTGGCRIYSMTREYAVGSELKSTIGGENNAVYL